MSLASLVIGYTTNKSARRFEEATKDPVRVQTDKILDLVRKNAGTEYGRRHRFASINTIRDYQRQVPVITYEDIMKDMDRVVEGVKNVFTAEDPVMFAQTSGTTGKPKYIPVTPTCRGREHRDQMRTWTFHAQKSHPDIFRGKMVSLVSPAVEGHTPLGIPFGSASGHIYKNMSWLVRNCYAIPYHAFEIADYSAKYYAIMRIALEHNVRFLATANPSSILKMCQKADEYGSEIIKDIRDGSLSANFDIEPEIRKILQKRCRPMQDRAKELEAFRERRGGMLLAGDYWPNLALIGCWKGGTVGHYLEKFPSWFDPDGKGKIPVRDWGYLSSECRGSIPLSDQGSQGVLTISANFFEFVEVEDLESKRDDSTSWTFLTAGDIEEGKAYYVFVTTSGGLYRYDINDIIRVAGRYNNTPEIIFLRKGRGMTNITGEKVSVNQIITAIQEASKVTGLVPAHFKALADAENSRYVFHVEFNSIVKGGAQKTFLEDIDKHLKMVNIEYKGKRESFRLKAPVLNVMKEGWYERGRRAQVEGGMRAFQAKTQLLAMKEMVPEPKEIDPDLDTTVELEE